MNLFVKQLVFWAILLFVCCGSVQAEIEMISVAAEKINLRSGPSVKSSILWEYGNGFPLRILEKKGNWYRVIDFENDSGWVYRKLLAKRPHMIVKKKKINIRSGPGSNYKLIGKANYGVVFKTLEQKAGWAKLKHENGLVGWVRRDLLWGW